MYVIKAVLENAAENNSEADRNKVGGEKYLKNSVSLAAWGANLRSSGRAIPGSRQLLRFL